MFLAHAGHWATTVAYFLPVVAFLGWLAVTQIRERRASRHEQGHAGPGPQDT